MDECSCANVINAPLYLVVNVYSLLSADDAKEDGDALDDEMGELGGGDGWDELGFGSKRERAKPSEEELARMTAVGPILFQFHASGRLTARLRISCQAHRSLKIGHAMHKRVLAVVVLAADSPKPLIQLTASALDDCLSRSSTLLSAADELVSALEPPQEAAGLSESLAGYRSAAEAIRGYLLSQRLVTPLDNKEAVQCLGDKLAGLAVGVGERGASAGAIDEAALVKERKWFDVCFTQLYKSLASVAPGGA